MDLLHSSGLKVVQQVAKTALFNLLGHFENIFYKTLNYILYKGTHFKAVEAVEIRWDCDHEIPYSFGSSFKIWTSL